jgi:hypothetical protein
MEQVTMGCLETTSCFSPVIDRQNVRVSVVIVRGLCDAWSKMKSTRQAILCTNFTGQKNLKITVLLT